MPVEAAKVTAAPLSEQVTAIGTLLSERSRYRQLGDSRPPQRDPLPGRPAGREGGAAVHPRRLGLSRPARRCRSQAETRRADPQAHEHAVHQQIRDRPVRRRVGLEPRREHGRRRARPRAAREGAHRGAVLRHRRTAPRQRRRIHHRGQALVNLEAIDPVKADFRVPEKFLPAIRVGQTIRIKVDAFPDDSLRGQGLRHRSQARCRRPQPAGPRPGSQ